MFQAISDRFRRKKIFGPRENFLSPRNWHFGGGVANF